MDSLRPFLNNLRLMLNIDADELSAAGVDLKEWRRFRADPHRWIISTTDANADAVWSIMQRRIGSAKAEESDTWGATAVYRSGQGYWVNGPSGETIPVEYNPVSGRWHRLADKSPGQGGD